MAAKKKASRKKAAKKKASPKSKKVFRKKTAKKATKKAKTSPKRGKTTKSKVANKKSIAVRKVVIKKKAAKKTKSIAFAPKGPSIAPAVKSINVNVRFELGRGQVTLKHVRGLETLGEIDVSDTDSVSFPNVEQFDGISINGSTSGRAKITTDRETDPLSDDQHPRKFQDEIISDSLIVMS